MTFSPPRRPTRARQPPALPARLPGARSMLRRPLVYGSLLGFALLTIALNSSAALFLSGRPVRMLQSFSDLALESAEYAVGLAIGWRLPVLRRPSSFELVISALAALLATGVEPVVMALAGPYPDGSATLWLGQLPMSLATMTAFAGLGRSAHRLRDLQLARARLTGMEAELARLRVNAFRAKLQPAFVLDCLDLIAARMRTAPEAADLQLMRLGELLRLTLRRIACERVPLDQELEFLSLYLRLAWEIRGEQGSLETDVPAALRHVPVPSAALSDVLDALRLRCGDGVHGGQIRLRVEGLPGELAITASCRAPHPAGPDSSQDSGSAPAETVAVRLPLAAEGGDDPAPGGSG